MTDAAEPTCGTGLAENAVVPAKLGELSAAMADVLELHIQALDLTDENAQAERDAYTKLVGEWRAIAAKLMSAAEHMRICEDLPMARHHVQEMTAPAVRDAFRALVSRKQELLGLLRQQAEADRTMLAEMGG